MHIANFLAKLYKKGLAYSTLCGYRSAISAYHVEVDGTKVGEHPRLIKLLKGVFNCRVPKKVVAPSWSLNKVLSSLKKAPYEPLNEVSLQWLSYKTAFLVCLCSASRCSDVSRLGYKDPYLRWVNRDMGVRLTPRALKKQCRPGHMFEEMFIPKYDKDRLLDPIRAIKMYLQRVKNRRLHDGLFITFGKGKRAGQDATAQTISRWVRAVIQLANPGATGVKAHSTRAVSTSLAFKQGVSLDAIMKAADWSLASTFANHYLKESMESQGMFARTVLEGSRE